MHPEMGSSYRGDDREGQDGGTGKPVLASDGIGSLKAAAPPAGPDASP